VPACGQVIRNILVDVEYRRKTRRGLLRHPSYKVVREDLMQAPQLSSHRLGRRTRLSPASSAIGELMAADGDPDSSSGSSLGGMSARSQHGLRAAHDDSGFAFRCPRTKTLARPPSHHGPNLTQETAEK
jgi:hypothetical protein